MAERRTVEPSELRTYDKAARASKTTVLMAIAFGGLDVVVDAVAKFQAQGWDARNAEALKLAALAELDRRMPIPEVRDAG